MAKLPPVFQEKVVVFDGAMGMRLAQIGPLTAEQVRGLVDGGVYFMPPFNNYDAVREVMAESQ